MLFAALDYAEYHLQRGKYSKARLAQSGWRLAVPENFLAKNEPPPGSMFILHTGKSFVSWIVMYVDDGPASHTGICVGRGHVVDTTTSGTLLHPFTDFLNGKSWIMVMDPPMTIQQRQRVVENAYGLVGNVGYAWFKAAFMGWCKITGSIYFPRSPNWRLQVDCISLLSTPLVVNLIRRRPMKAASILAPGAYAFLIAKNALMRRGKRLVDAAAKANDLNAT